MIALESVYIINYVTRFTEEIFAFLIASVFLADAFKKIFRVIKFIIATNQALIKTINNLFKILNKTDIPC